MHQTHAFAAAAGGGLQHHRIADARGNLLGLLERFEAARSAGHKRNAGALHGLPRAGFRAHRVHRRGGGADELHARVGAGSGELRVLGEKSVAGMDGVCAGARGDVENLLNVEIGLGRCGCADGISLIGLADVQRGAIDVRVDGNRGNSHLVAGADDAHGNLAAIGDENFLEHFPERRNGLCEPKILQEIAQP